MQTVDREEFMNWTQGILLNRDKHKKVIVNELDCKLAEEALKNGETIYLTKNGKIVSIMIPEGNNFVEKNISDYI